MEGNFAMLHVEQAGLLLQMIVTSGTVLNDCKNIAHLKSFIFHMLY